MKKLQQLLDFNVKELLPIKRILSIDSTNGALPDFPTFPFSITCDPGVVADDDGDDGDDDGGGDDDDHLVLSPP